MFQSEWVEDHAEDLRRNGMAYINLGTAFSGYTFSAAGSPALESILLNVLSRIIDPKQKVPLSDLWGKKKLPGLGAAGDYGAFQHFAGMTSIDIGFTTPNPLPGKTIVNSCLDTYTTLVSSDPDFEYPSTIAQILSLLTLELADSSNMPFNMTNYASSALEWLTDLEQYATKKAPARGKKLDLKSLKEAVDMMQKNMPEFDQKIEEWSHDGSFIEIDESLTAIHRISHNARMANFEHHLLEDEGTWGRPWFKHVLMAPKVGSDSSFTSCMFFWLTGLP